MKTLAWSLLTCTVLMMGQWEYMVKGEAANLRTAAALVLFFFGMTLAMTIMEGK